MNAARLHELLALNRAITDTVGYAALLELVVDKARALTGAGTCALVLAKPGADATIVASSGITPELARDFRAPMDERIGTALREALRLDAGESLIAVPMVMRGDVRGLLAVARVPTARTADDDDETFLSALADQAAIALGHALHLAELQAALDEAARERAARETLLEELTAERSWLRTVIDCSPVAVLLVEGPDGERVTPNRNAVTMFGRPLEGADGIKQYASQILGTDGVTLAHDDLPALRALRGERVNRELVIKRTDGNRVAVLAHAAPIFGTRGEALGAIVIYEDISRIKELERAREEWTSMVVHDLRQPISAIALRAKLVAKHATADVVVADEVQHIVASARRLDRMIDDLLDVSLIEGKHLTLTRRSRAVVPMIRQIVDRCAATNDLGRVELVARGELPAVDADSGRIEQVLANLLSNAAKYGDRRAPVEVSIARGDGMVEIAVKNHGHGISAEVLPTLFRRFERGHSRGPKGEGLGLGLYISRAIVEAHGGTIWADSTPDDTTAFHFTLPLSARPAARDP